MRGPSASGSMPSTCSDPPDRGDTQAIMRMVDDLPAPFGPRKPKISPGATSTSTPHTAYRLDLPEALAQAAGLHQSVPHTGTLTRGTDIYRGDQRRPARRAPAAPGTPGRHAGRDLGASPATSVRTMQLLC